MIWFGRTKSRITKDEISENVPHLEITEVVVIHCHIVNNNYQPDSKVLYTVIPSKSFRQLLDISPKNVKFVKNFDSKFSFDKVWLTDL